MDAASVLSARPISRVGATRRTVSVILAVVAVPVSAFVGAAAVLVAAGFTARPALLILVGALSLFIVALAFGILAARVAVLRRQLPFGLGLATATLALVAGLSAATIFRPADVAPAPAAPAPEGLAFWVLPTGSRIAYRHFPAVGEAAPAPIVFLHGGPGSVVEAYTGPLAGLARYGYDVYLYDQVGSGRSSRLRDMTGYTVARQVADLEAIREQIGAAQLVLLGQSWGGTLAAQYMAAHPERVAQAIITSPGAMDLAAWGDAPIGSITDRATPEQAERFTALFLSPRMLAVRLLAERNPEAAYQLVPEAELDAVFRAASAHIAVGGVCDPAAAPSFDDIIWSYWVNTMTSLDQSRQTGDTPERLARVQVPTLILRAECDYVRWEVTRQYRDTLPNATLVYVADAGHQLAIEQPATFDALAGAFLRGEALPLPAYTGSQSPGG